MKNLLTIGKVAKLKNISIKSLRYYDEIGVLKPAFINVLNNYRYYSKEQLYLLDAIIMCVELGIPLKNLQKYMDIDSMNLKMLLNDGKILANKKIDEINKCLDNLENSINYLNKNPSFSNIITSYTRMIEERTILVIPFEDSNSFENYHQKILKLFMLAQSLDMTVTYPSGILYQYNADTLHKFIFLHIEGTNNYVDSRIQTLKGGSYLCQQHNDHKINSGIEIFSDICSNQKDFSIIETDIIHETIHPNKNTLELQILL